MNDEAVGEGNMADLTTTFQTETPVESLPHRLAKYLTLKEK